MPYRVLIIIALCLLLSACLRTSKPETIDSRCMRALDTASQLLNTNTKMLDPSNVSLAKRLISAARVARQQQEFIHCLEKSSRAITLLKPASSADTKSTTP